MRKGIGGKKWPRRMAILTLLSGYNFKLDFANSYPMGRVIYRHRACFFVVDGKWLIHTQAMTNLDIAVQT